MRRGCAWCGRDMGPGDHPAGNPVTPGVCPECQRRCFPSPARDKLQRPLDRLPAPVVVVDGDARILGANRAAREMFPGAAEDLPGPRVGDALECVHAREPGGCGGTVHCRSCAIRNLVADTLAHDRGHEDVPATRDILTPTGSEPAGFRITTEKFGGLVLLRIERVRRSAA
ncbi:MAG TPA: PAS domain-containing protein [Candidatus Saccharimonadales bacterium]|nr:PAS domain-containing protein [Candidatus Saccharimonadales bacterium]